MELAQEAVEMVMPSIESKQQHLKLEFPKKDPVLRVDVDMIRRVMINLLENASKIHSSGWQLFPLAHNMLARQSKCESKMTDLGFLRR